MPNTYVALASTAGDGTTPTITFNSIPATYTDLVIVASVINSNGSDSLSLRFNGDTGSNYSYTVLGNSGSTPESYRSSNNTYMQCGLELDTSPCPNIIQIMNYANTSINKTVIARGGQGDIRTRAIVGLWRSTAAITSITLRNPSGAGAYSTSSTFSLYGIANADQGAAKATGGMITEDSQYWYHTFAASGTFTPKQALTCDYLVVAGGGGGGSTYGGGGGAGGYRTSIGGSPLSLSATGYAVTVGAGGAGIASGQANSAGNGNNSVFSTITSTYGGGGGNDVSPRTGAAGGSGGGGATTTGGAGNLGGFSPVEGYAGGTGASSVNYGSGGGGGAGAVGTNGTTTVGGNGGTGTANSISGSSVTYAGGGGGGTFQGGTIGTGGAGGGGNAGASGGNNVGIAGTANTGGGGGGASYQSVSVNGGAGGSGIVIVRYAK